MNLTPQSYNIYRILPPMSTFNRSFGSRKHCRKLFRRALERVWDGVEAIGLAYLRFEQETGDLESMAEFKKRYEDRSVIGIRLCLFYCRETTQFNGYY